MIDKKQQTSKKTEKDVIQIEYCASPILYERHANGASRVQDALQRMWHLWTLPGQTKVWWVRNPKAMLCQM